MHRLFRIKAYEAEHGPHFDEEMARKAVSKMENEDGSRGQHWSIEETTSLANQHGIRMDEKFNKYDWYVALNMVYSDYYRVVVNMTNSNNPKHFVELAKAWLCDKDIEEGKMWYYYVYIMCDKIRNAEEELYEREYGRRHKEDDDDDDEYEYHGMMRRGGRRSGMMGRRSEYNYDHDYEREERNRENAALASKLAECCCNTQRSIDSVNLNLTKMGYEDQLAMCNQTNTLVNTMNQNTLSLRDSNLANTQAILQKIDNFENIYRQDKMDRLTSENLALKGQISQANQNQYIAATVQANTAPIVNRLNSLQSDVDGIKCKLPNTVSVPYPQLAVYNPEIARAAAYGAFAGENYGLNTQCGCC